MGTTVTIKRGDIGRTFSATVTVGGLSVEPATPDTALFLMRQGTTLVSKTATVGTITYADGTATIPLTYTTVAGDLDLATGSWLQEWEIGWTGGALITAPADGYDTVVIVGDLNPT